jgi:hypothetical protein
VDNDVCGRSVKDSMICCLMIWRLMIWCLMIWMIWMYTRNALYCITILDCTTVLYCSYELNNGFCSTSRSVNLARSSETPR